MRLFFSWQQDLPNNKPILRKILQEICKELRIEYTDDTRGESGGEHIVDVLQRKIENSDIFVGDISLVGKSSENSKKLANSNVCYELGFAEAKLTRRKLLLIVNEEYGSYDDMPFDLGKRMVTTFHTKADALDEKERVALKAELLRKIRLLTSASPDAINVELNQSERSLLYWAVLLGDGYISNYKNYKDVGMGFAILSIGEQRFYSNPSAIYYSKHDLKKDALYRRAIGLLMNKGLLTKASSTTPSSTSLIDESIWVVTEEGEVVANSITEGEVYGIIMKATK